MTEIKIDRTSDKQISLNTSNATSSGDTTNHLPSYLKPVQANEILGGAESKSAHALLSNYINNEAKRNSTGPIPTMNIVKDAKHVVREAIMLDSEHAGVVKDLALMIGAVADSTAFKETNSKYQVQKEANRAVWRCLNVERTGVPALWRSTKQRFSEPKPVGNFPPPDLRDILLNMLDQMGKWIVPTGIEDAHKPYGSHDRQAKSLNRVGEVLAKIDDPMMRAEVVAKMVSISKDVPIALGHALDWLKTDPMRNERKIVFDEAIRLIEGEDLELLSTVLNFLALDETIKTINNLPLDDKLQLKNKLDNKVTPLLKDKYMKTEVNSDEERHIESLQSKLEKMKASIHNDDGEIS